MFFFRTLNLPSTFGGLALTILKNTLSNARVVHVVCDTYPDKPSIKDSEHDSRGHSELPYRITGSDEKRPTDLEKALRSSVFKRELLMFLKEEWTSEIYAPYFAGHRFYFETGYECFLYTTHDGIVHRTQVHELNSTHEEADTRIIFHADFITENSEQFRPDIVVRSNDTDVFILLLHHALHINATFWMDAGINSRNTRRMINISELSNELTDSICEALPSFHAFTGSDYTASFMRKAKWKPFEIMKNSDISMSAQSQLGSSEVVHNDVANIIERYVCAIYGLRNFNSVNEGRLHLFHKMYAPKKYSDPLLKIKSTDPCCLPPCHKVLHQKLLRTNYVPFLWKNARKANPIDFDPIGHGREIQNGKLVMTWYEGEQVPKDFIDTNSVTLEKSHDDDVDLECSYTYSSDEDTETEEV